MPLLEVDNLKVHYHLSGGFLRPKVVLKAVDGVSFKLNVGETLGLVGESGCGKSTLGRAIVRLEKPTSGKITIDSCDIATLNGSKLRHARKDFQMIFQDPYGSLNPKLSIFSALNEVLRLAGRSTPSQRLEMIGELLRKVGLNPDQMYRYPHQFSGGQRQRIGIARALAMNPKLIVADEPVSALDVSVQAQIVNLLQDIQKETATAFLFIAHDLGVVEHISQRIMVMYLGRIVEIGESHELCSNPKHPYTQSLLSAVPVLDQSKRHERIVLSGDVPSPINPPTGCAFHTRCPRAMPQCSKITPQLKSLSPSHQCACLLYNT